MTTHAPAENSRLDSGCAAGMPDTVIRPARRVDLPDVYRLGAESLASDAWTLEAILREAEAPHARIHLLEVYGHGVAAYALSWLVADEATLVQVATAPAWRRRGFARALLHWVLNELEADGARVCHLEVRRSRTAARALYEALGFRVEGVRKGYYRDPGDDALLMSRRAQSIR